MYVEAAFYCEHPRRFPAPPRGRYAEYYRDLHHRYQVALDESTFLKGSQYKFHELAYTLFNELEKIDLLKDIDLIATAYWVPEFDPDFTSFELHLLDHYNLNCKMFDVIDQGSVCAITALSLIHRYQQNATSKKALCVTLDQTTIPRSNDVAIPIPNRDVSAGIVLSALKPTPDSIRIVDVHLWTEQQLIEEKFDVLKLITTLLQKHAIPIQQCTLSIKRNTTAFRMFDYCKHKNKQTTDQLELNYLPLTNGSSDAFQLIHHIYQKIWVPSKKFVLYLDEDVESLTTGLIILQMPEDIMDIAS